MDKIELKNELACANDFLDFIHVSVRKLDAYIKNNPKDELAEYQKNCILNAMVHVTEWVDTLNKRIPNIN